ncbi:MAG: hypothetical protein ACOX0H_00460 [Patescibacteria group bacterium]|jgi:hypothetical protein|nr:MAG: hypothetical protein BWY03_00440 [Parcubacteria group bacterium ADurb.Bin159]HPY08645.1 hypothetical protein [bacterium]
MKKILIIFLIFGGIFCLAFLYYKPIIFQEGDPRPLFKAIWRLNFSEEKIVKLDLSGEKYLTKSKDGRIILQDYLKLDNFKFSERMGSAYFFTNNTTKIIAIHKYYSRFYSIWSLTRLEKFSEIPWSEYKNNNYKFSFSYPSFSINSKWWNNFFNSEEYLLPNQVLNKNNNFYLTQKYKIEKDIKTGELIKTENTFFPEYDNTYNYPIPWHIVIFNIENETDLEQIIKQKMGPGCSYKTKTPTDFVGNYKIEIDGDGLGLDKTECFANYTYYIIYSPAQKKVAFWSTGQECQIGLGFFPESCFDEKIAASFHFFEE